MTAPVEIVMATYNGAPYIGQQIESILLQTHHAWRLIVRDDGSSDGTTAIVRAYQSRYPDRIVILEDNVRAGGASANFSLLLQATSADYVMCCDQDDEWVPHKIEFMLRHISELEMTYGRSVPLLVHSDLQVVDVSGRELARSFWEYQHLDPRWADTFSRLLTQNVVTGCATMFNRALLDRALPIPIEAVMHDWWLALVACAFGRVFTIPEQTVLYRQHASNTVGAKAFGVQFLVQRVQAFRSAGATSVASATAAQAQAFVDRFSEDDGAVVYARAFARLPEQGWLVRRLSAVRHDFRKIGMARQLGWLIYL